MSKADPNQRIYPNLQMSPNLGKYKFSNIIVFLGAVFVLFLAAQALAVSKSDIQYPVKELGSCKNETECRAYCANPSRMEACVNFAEKYSLMSKTEIQTARKFMKVGAKGPGGCSGKDACETYCNDIGHIDECLTFAEANEFMDKGELAEAKQVQAAIKKGTKLPGGCTSKAACESYCEDVAHMEECITFAETAGFMSGDELKEAQKVLQAVRKGAKPPPCRGRKECDNYCSKPENLEGCLNFAEAAGLIEPDELQDAKKMMEAIKKGVKPPNCRGRQECDEYCRRPENTAECMDFAVAAGFVSAEEAELFRKTGGMGPGGCRGEAECNAFCENPDNQEECYKFGAEHGLISEDDLGEMEEGKIRMQEALEEAPEEVVSCLVSRLGSGVIGQIKAGTVMPSQKMGDAMKSCFEQFSSSYEDGDNGGYREGDEDGFYESDGGERGSGGFGGDPSDLSQLPPEAEECVKGEVGADVFEGIKAGKQFPPSNFFDVIASCTRDLQQFDDFEEFDEGEGNLIQSAKSFLLKAWSKLRGR